MCDPKSSYMILSVDFLSNMSSHIDMLWDMIIIWLYIIIYIATHYFVMTQTSQFLGLNVNTNHLVDIIHVPRSGGGDGSATYIVHMLLQPTCLFFLFYVLITWNNSTHHEISKQWACMFYLFHRSFILASHLTTCYSKRAGGGTPWKCLFSRMRCKHKHRREL